MYVIKARYNGSLVCGFKKTPIQFERGAYWKEPLFCYPNKKKQILFATKEKAEKYLFELSPNSGLYVKKVRDKEVTI